MSSHCCLNLTSFQRKREIQVCIFLAWIPGEDEFFSLRLSIMSLISFSSYVNGQTKIILDPHWPELPVGTIHNMYRKAIEFIEISDFQR